MGNTVHRTPPGTPGIPGGRRAPGFSLSRDPPGDSRRAPPTPLGALGARQAGVSGASGPRLRARPAAGLCTSGGRVQRPGYLGDPGARSPGFGKMCERAAGAMPAPPLLCSSRRALVNESGATRGVTEPGSPGFRRPEAANCAETAAAESGGVLSGLPQFAAAEPPTSARAAFPWPRSHAHPGCAPLWCPRNWGLFSPSESLLQTASPLVQTTPEFPGPEYGDAEGGMGWTGEAEEALPENTWTQAPEVFATPSPTVRHHGAPNILPEPPAAPGPSNPELQVAPTDSSPPARLLATRPCCGPGPERRPVLGEALRFHAQAKGKNVRLDGHSRRATRRNSFCNGVTFTQRPIRLYEQVRLRLVAVRPGWSGALRFGFTAHDPSLMSAHDIPKYACPDLVTRPGYWAKALPENLALRDTVLAYWADRHGRVFYSVNDGEPVLFHCGVAVGGPLWALIDVYGITDEVQLLESAFADTLTPARLGQPRFTACLPPSSHDAANFDNDELENNQVVAKLGHLALGRVPGPPPADAAAAAIPCGPRDRPRPASSPALLEADLRFHATRGPDVSLSADRKVACAPRPDGGRTLVFSERPLRPGESLFVEVGRPGLAAPGAVAFGITSCDPGALRPAELPADPDALLDRKEYWVVARAGPVPSGGDALSFTLRPGGDVLLGVNGRPRGRLLCVDTTQALWAFFAVRGGAAGQLRLLGTLQSSPATTTPSGSLSGSQDDSDSDMTFSVNQSSSASESSLVTAPSSPMSPPVSPVFPPPEPAGSKNGECTVCFDGEVDTVIYTCGHMCLCHNCGLRLKRQARACCPICRRPIKDVIKIYRP
ncbi:E3 ubiquitin-protein ligase NEURL1B [Cynocephalus volans]|uniref:E3 ubiquitin-protein ligase NEURL1B n=1 Tax=Cynocephalus volans TaxID=110931 RepID=UPI002FC9A760